MILQLSVYFLSFTPLWISVLFINAMSLVHGTKTPWAEKISIVGILILFFIAFIVMLRILKTDKIGTRKYQLIEVIEEKFVTAEFLATFIMPLYAFDFTKWEDLVLFGFFFCIFGFLCVRHNYFCFNIILEVLNYKTYDCKLIDERGNEVAQKIISKRNLKIYKNEEIFIKGLNNDYCLDCFKSE
ncbi:MAG: hypothetical protein SPL86_08795 [Succiniclasticum sp.]|uniref:hypothetical protein n=1 Tax=Succiniclasticum sp. TaxID=2775030 RepID=UPI002A90D065|nr:hypothetical protein [Succiniclasticum sp.]MDY6291568.1 hypothetical protein [Succiniclasticum sp.]